MMHGNTKFIYGVVAILSALLFCTIYGVNILNPSYTAWLLIENGDLTQHYLGWKAYRFSEWHFPLGMIDRITYPYLTSIIFTDSIPILAVFFKICSPLLPEEFQYFGLWGIVSFILQGVLSARILKNFTDNKYAIITASLIFVLAPAMLFRMYVHTALAGQWLLLLGLELIFSYECYKKSIRNYIMALLIGVLSSSVHIYLLFMNGIILLGYCVLDVLKSGEKDTSIKIGSIYFLSSLVTIALLGGFSSDVNAASGGLGTFSFNLNGLFNPQGWSSILPNLNIRPGQYEGFAYLGAGAIVLLILSISVFIYKKRIIDDRHTSIALFVICSITVFVAASPAVYFGTQKIYSIFSIPNFILNLWSVFRASGRISWILVYIVMFVSCMVLCKYLKNRVLVLVFITGLLIQGYDLHEVLINKNSCISPVKEYKHELNNNFWNYIGSNEKIKKIIFISRAEDMDREKLYSITNWGLSNGKYTNDFYLARPIDEKVKEKRIENLNNISDDVIFLFVDADILQCNNYNLNYYYTDGLVIGYAKELTELSEYKTDQFIYKHKYSNNKFLQGNGSDEERGRVLNLDAVSHGPYCHLAKGTYIININGINLLNDIELLLQTDCGKIIHKYDYISKENNKLSIKVNMLEDVDKFELYIKNCSSSFVVLKGFDIEYVK